MDLNEIYEETYKELRNIKIPVKKAKLKISNLRKIRGKCLCLNNKYTIEIMDKLVKTNDVKMIKRTLAHELLHTVEGSMNHKGKWIENAKKAEEKYHYGLFEAYSETTIDSDKKIKNVFYCEHCNLTYNCYNSETEIKCSWCSKPMKKIVYKNLS